MEKGSLKVIITQLEVLFQRCNDRFFNGEVQKPVIAVNSDSSNSCYGWMTTWKAWQEEGTDGYYEINICAEHLNRDIKDIVGTMLHEMTHLYNLQNGVKDTSRGNTYHNRKFKAEAEKRGLNIEQDRKYGWTITTLNVEGTQFASEFEGMQFGLYRTPIVSVETATARRKSSSRKYVCPECGTSIRATKEVHLLCGECSCEENLVRMELEDSEEE